MQNPKQQNLMKTDKNLHNTDEGKNVLGHKMH